MSIYMNKCPNCNGIKKNSNQHKFCSTKCGYENRRKSILAKTNVPEIIECYTIKKYSSNKIGKLYGLNNVSVLNILRESGISIRSQTENGLNANPNKGNKWSKEQKEAQSKKNIKYYKDNPETIDLIRQKTLLQISEGRMPKSNTSIEKIIANLLTELKVSFEYQKVFAFWCYDFYLPKYKLFIECDGDYWHAHPEIYGSGKIELNATQKNNLWRGKAKETYVKNRGYNLLRFWERDILNNLSNIKNKLEKLFTLDYSG